MSSIKINHSSLLSYRLLRGVTFIKTNSTLYLIRKNPLATITLNSAWETVLGILKDSEYISFTEICTHINADPDKIEIYLNSLVRKGFMECKGCRTLKAYPFISIIIPVRNRPDDIAQCLESLLKLDYPPDEKEIIVVDDASDDNTADVVSSFPVKLLKNQKRMQASYSRNLAAKEAKGEILAFIDSDCTADPLWLKDLVSCFNDKSNAAAGGLVDSWFDKKALDRYEKKSSSLNMGGRSKSIKEDGKFFYLPTCNLLVRKDIFMKLDGFNVSMTVGEDVDFCWRLTNSGYEIEYRPSGTVFHKHRNKITAFFTRRFQYGTSEPGLQKKHPDRIKKMFYMPAAILFWIFMFAAFFTGEFFILSGSVITLFTDTQTKWRQVKLKKLQIGYSSVLSAVFRGYFVSVYFWCSFFSRYYLVFAFLLFPLIPRVCLVLFINHFIVSICEFVLKRPLVNIVSFACFFTIEQLAYQLGAWYGCFKYLKFNPVNPKICRWKS